MVLSGSRNGLFVVSEAAALQALAPRNNDVESWTSEIPYRNVWGESGGRIRLAGVQRLGGAITMARRLETTIQEKMQ